MNMWRITHHHSKNMEKWKRRASNAICLPTKSDTSLHFMESSESSSSFVFQTSDISFSSHDMNRVSLSSVGMSRVSRLHENPFTFIVGEKEYRTTTPIAVFLSPRVSRLISIDAACETLCIDVDDRFGVFNLLLSLADGETLSVEENGLDNRETFDVFVKLAHELENQELIAICGDIIDIDEPLSLANAVQQLTSHHSLSMSITEDVAFVASHLQEVSFDSSYNSILEALGPDLSHVVLMSPSLCITDEDWLLDTILRCSGSEYRCLISCVRFDFLSCAAMSRFIDNFSLAEINAPTWTSLCARLLCPTVTPDMGSRIKESGDVGTITTLDYEGAPFDGIIGHLRKSCGGNPHRRRVIRVTASSRQDVRDNLTYKIVDYTWDGWFVTRNQPDSWIEVDFKKARVNVSGYSIRGNRNNDHNPESWVIEGSNDNLSWTNIDEIRGYKFDSHTHVGVFEIPAGRRSDQYFRYIRLRQVDLNSSNEDYLVLTNLEFFGKIRTKTDVNLP